MAPAALRLALSLPLAPAVAWRGSEGVGDACADGKLAALITTILTARPAIVAGAAASATRRRAARSITVTLLLAVVCAPVSAQQPDSLGTGTGAHRNAEPFFTTSDVWLALGFAAGVAAMAPVDRHLAGVMRDSSLQAHRVLRGAGDTFRLLGFPGSVIIGSGAYLAGRHWDAPKLAALGLHGTEAVMLSYVFVSAGKNFLGRGRPDVSEHDPFDFGFARGPVLYTGAALVGLSRMYHNRHWASDVVGGPPSVRSPDSRW